MRLKYVFVQCIFGYEWHTHLMLAGTTDSEATLPSTNSNTKIMDLKICRGPFSNGMRDIP